ncbi:amidohydrolase family protein [Karstenula rhodostoma CBS 690.94]|uniref:6-methylsalicylate decarboxylase n=1 Tax=Karstenula rhodostoma CBS 690.94 TaxID=1392251 RepID=A0A9P4UBK0_9PLEO|nr:amidohydrolase family protein [Karstenula rhodostoma CBS 690.94]
MGSIAETPQGIDVHHHFIPECYAKALDATGGDPSGWKLPNWSVAASKDLMQAHGIRTSILSLTAPGCSILQGAPAATLARAVNEEAHAIRNADPTAFGFFAALPPVEADATAAVAEIAHALDVLGADGITLYTRYGPGTRYLGHEHLRPVWAALNARKAVVFVHPTHAADTRLVNAALPQPIIDYPHETTRAAVDMITSGVVRDFPDVNIILSHAGGSLPFLATRAAHLLADARLTELSAEEFLTYAKSFYFDTALSGNDFSLPLLLAFAPPGHVLFGSDFPYAPTPTIATHTVAGAKVLAEKKGEEEVDLAANALRLLPRLR